MAATALVASGTPQLTGAQKSAILLIEIRAGVLRGWLREERT